MFARSARFARSAICFLSVAAQPGLARATPEAVLDGRWRQGPLREDFTIQQWMLNGCGPAPQTNATGGGEVVTVRTEGDDLSFIGGGRVYRTNQCYDAMPSLARESHSRDPSGKTWRTRCTTPPNDPRKAILNSLLVATTDTHMELIETGRYEVVLETGRCVADVKRTRSFDIVPEERAGAVAPPATASAPTPSPRKPESRAGACDVLGEPVRLEVSPSKKLLRTGESFQFRGRVVDDKGCATHTRMTWRLQAGAVEGITVDATGLVSVGGNASEGPAEIVVEAAMKETRVAVEVSSPGHYDSLLARSGLNASGENESASIVTMPASSLGVGASRVDDASEARRWTFISIVGVVLALLGVLAAVLGQRARRATVRARNATSRHASEVSEVLLRRKVRAQEHADQKRAHDESVAAAEALARQRLASSTYAEPPTSASSTATSGTQGRGKICPTCGVRFDRAAAFCGKDGTQLVLLN